MANNKNNGNNPKPSDFLDTKSDFCKKKEFKGKKEYCNDPECDGKYHRRPHKVIKNY